MPNLLEVAPAERRVSTDKYGEVAVYGLSLTAFTDLLKEHPELIELFKRGQKEGFENVVNVQEIVDMGMDILIDLLVLGTGYPLTNKEAQKICRYMNVGDQLALGEAILEETLPNGVESFLERMTAALQRFGLKVRMKDLSELSNLEELKQAS